MAHILIAEDNSSIGSFLSGALRRAGHDVDVVTNGIHALAELQDDEAEYDMLLTDITMPGMDGVELATWATDFRPDLPVLFINGFSAVAVGQKAAQKQPFHLKDVVSTVDRLLAA